MPEERSARERIIDAYFEALKNKRYDKITVSSLIKKAGVNRSTFYRYFIDIYDLYDSVCDETAKEIISSIKFENLDGIFEQNFSLLSRQYFNSYDIHLKHMDKVNALAGKNGNLKIVKKYRERYIERLKAEMGTEKFDKNEEYLLDMVPDCNIMVVCVLYFLKNGEIFSLRDRLPNVSLRKDFMSNILTVNDILSDEKSAIEYKLLIAAYNAWKKKKTINLTVSDLTKAAGISRTEFYTCHKNLAGFYNDFAVNSAYVLSKYVIDTALSDMDTLDKFKFNMQELTESIGSFLDSIDHSILFGFLFICCSAAYRKFRQIIKNEIGEEMFNEKGVDILTFFCGVFLIVTRYAISGDRENYLYSLELAFNFREENIMKTRSSSL